MPRYPGCEKMLGTEDVKKSCADGLMLNHIYRTLKYPSEAREKGIEGMVVLKFIVGKDGRVRDADIVRNLNGGCGQAALAAVESMYDMKESWMPGKKDGVAVDVEYFLPVKFKLAKEKRIRVNL